MATAKTISDLKTILKTPRIRIIEVMRQVNAKNKTRYFMLVEGERHPMTKALYDHLDSLALRQDNFYTRSVRTCWNHYKTLLLNH